MSRWTAPLLRRPRNASPVPLAPRQSKRSALYGYQPTQAIYAYLEAYLNDPVIRPIVARIFQGVSAANWRLYTKSRTGEEQDRTEVTSHPILDFMAKPNAFQTWPELVARGQQHWELTGETSLALGRVNGVKQPLDCWVLRPDRLTPVPDPYNYLSGWVYTAPGDGERIPLTTDELLRMVDPSPVDPYRGAGAVQALMRDLDASMFSKEWQAEFFQNSAQPSGVIQADHRLDDAEFEEFTSRWAQQHQGVSKAHRIAVLEDNMQWIQNSFSLRDLQIAELDGVGRDKILAAFGMPQSMIGIVKDVNRANAEANEYMFASDIIKPRLVNWRSMLNHQLLPMFDASGRLELDFDDPVPENSEANIAERKTNFDVLIAATAAGFDSAEVAEYLDLPDFTYTKPEVPAFGGGNDNLEGITSPIQTPDNPTSNRRRGTIVRDGDGVGYVWPDAEWPRIDSAMRWVSIGHEDSSCCEPCLDKIGTLYRNRQAAYVDYPPGQGYIGCIGAQFGNHCRCSVVKRRSQRDD